MHMGYIMAVYDTFLFFNELDLLEIRLNLLNDCVDYFVISESNITFSGKDKPLYYFENKERFKQFEHKIIHQVIKDTPTNFVNLPSIENPQTKDELCLNMIYAFNNEATNFPKNELHWGRDFFQRECLHRAWVNCKDDDIITFSDVDEIPNPDIIKQIIQAFPSDKIYTLCQKEFNYYLNMYKQDGWMGPRLATYATIKNTSLNKIRSSVHEHSESQSNGHKHEVVNVTNGGWHFTSLGGFENVIKKIESWGHQEFNNDQIKNNVQKNIEARKDIFRRKGAKRLKAVPIDSKIFPLWLVENQDNYKHLINFDVINAKSSFLSKIFRKILSF